MQMIVVVAILAMLVGTLATALVMKGSDDGTSSHDGAPEVFLEPAGAAGPDPFSSSVAAATLALPTTTTTSRAAVAANTVVSVAGSQVGLYGGSLNTASCNREQLVRFLETHPDKAAAWAAVQGIRVDRIRQYVFGLTSVVLLRDTRVTNHGFVNGRATPHQSVLQAGTAVLVDAFGVPRARCFCGNPLTPPTPLTNPVPVGPRWSTYSPTTVVVVVPRVEVQIFVLVDLHTGTRFHRPTGSGGGRDVATMDESMGPGDAGPGDVTTTTTTDAPAPVASPSGTYTVQFSGELITPPCSPWGAGTGAMTVTIEGASIGITLSRDGGPSTDFAGGYDPVTGAFSAPDVQYGNSPLAGTFTKVDGVFTVGDGRQNAHNANGGDCIGAFTASETVG
jgi:hypothetical protein